LTRTHGITPAPMAICPQVSVRVSFMC
jgi:hypothetical protein